MKGLERIFCPSWVYYFVKELVKMHMADALISPIVGGTMWVATTGVMAYSIKKVQNEMDDIKIPLMGVMGAFVFAAQMINFSIPGTGSSGHLAGGMLLAMLLGPYGGFLAMASVLLIQALFFADGGLLAYGCNVFNLGFFSCFVAYPLINKWFSSKEITSKKIFVASMVSALIALQMGAFSVVLQTFLSGKTELPFGTFVLFMQPIHLAIGVVEGLVTAAVVTYVWKARPEIIEKTPNGQGLTRSAMRKVITTLVLCTVIVGSVFSWFASANPDGLEWSMLKTAGETELEATEGIHKALSQIQTETSFLPDYGFKSNEGETDATTEAGEPWPAVSAGTSISGIVGGLITLLLAVFIGFMCSLIKRRKNRIIV
jgi:cobalt/nickel transport system permease protein